MKIQVEVSEASLSDVVDAVFDVDGDLVSVTTLGDVVVEALLARLAADPRWDDLSARFAAAVDRYVEQAAPGYIAELIRAEVARQLTAPSAVAAVRGQRSTVAQAVVATEVTTQLRAQFAPLVDAALMKVSGDMDALRLEALAAFRRGSGA